jgi:hypothetical protein
MLTGPWAWSTVFEPLRSHVSPMNRISGWCTAGLQQWKRTLLYSRAGDRQFLVTLACEGGLPLRVLEKQGAKLTNFFVHLLEGYYRAPERTVDAAVQVSEQNAFYLPRTLRQDVVFRLGAELVAALVELWQDIGGNRDTGDPIAALDAAVPGWRERLPLRAEDDAINALLRPTGVQGQGPRAGGEREAALARSAPAGARTAPGKSRTGWISRRSLAARCCGSGLHSRPMRTCRHVCVWRWFTERAAMRWLGSAARPRGSGDNANYHLELLRARGACLRNAEVFEPAELKLVQGDREHALPAQFAAPWTEALPWVFVERNGALQRLCEGGARTRAPRAWVVLPAGFVVTPDAEGATREGHGAAALAGLVVVSVTGRVLLTSPDGMRFVVTCGAEEDTEEFWTATGPVAEGYAGARARVLGTAKAHRGTRRRPPSECHSRPARMAGGGWRRRLAE